MEGAALVLLAGDGDGALHLVHNIFGDGHSQAGALGALHPGAVLPGEGLKDLLLEFLRHADARVPHDKVGADVAGPQGGVLLGHGHGDAAPLGGEFQGVGEQVEQHLIEADAVAVDVLLGDILNEDVKALFSGLHLGLNDADNALGGLPEADHVQVEGQLAALDLGHVQHVVDQPQQMLAGEGDFAQTGFHLVPVVHVGGGDGSHTHDGVHGGADVVAHVGEELALGLVGPFRLPLRPLHLGQLPAGHPEIEEEYHQGGGQQDAAAGQRGGRPVAAQVRHRPVQRAVGHDGHQVPLGVGEGGAVDMPALSVGRQHQAEQLPLLEGALHV